MKARTRLLRPGRRGAALSDPFRDANFLRLVQAKAALDAAERDARYQFRFYKSGKQLLAQFEADLIAATERRAA
jgi:hypothetical protein